MAGGAVVAPTDAEVAALIARASVLPTPILADGADGAGVIDPAVAQLTLGTSLCGRALTARCAEGDVLGGLATLLKGHPGEILVVGGVHAPLSLMGEFMMRACVQLRLGGAVLDGYIRDSDAIRESRFPVYCRGTTPRIQTTGDRGQSRVPVRCGGIDVMPGDLVCADDDGVIFIPWNELDSVLDRAEAKLAKEQRAEEQMALGAGIEALYGEFLESDEESDG
jgi:4-hydroxy-4-methyl-2-oxoglutarate aldolase